MAAITSAGAGSGLQLEQIISATLSAKQASFEAQITTKETDLQTSLSGVGQLKSAISTFTSAADSLSAADAFNLRKINITQSTDDPVLAVTSTSGTSNGSYNVIVNQLSQGSRLESAAGTFTSASHVVTNSNGQLTFSAGSDKTFTIDVAAGTTLQQLRSLINNNGNNFGLSANIINLNGESKLVLDSSVSGAGNDLSISASSLELKVFDTSDSANQMTQTQSAQDASISIDGATVTSSTNDFTDVIQGTKISVLRVSDKDSTTGALTSNKVAIQTDTQGIQDKISSFVKAYNSLATTLTNLGKRSTIVAGQRQNDGGLLSGDTMVRAVSSYMFNAISAQNSNTGSLSTIFDIGVSIDNYGKLSLNSTKLSDVLSTNFDQVGTLIGGSSGLAATMSTYLKTYSATAGTLDQRTDQLNTSLRQVEKQRTDFNTSQISYEDALRKKYGAFDTLLVKLKSSTAALTAATTTSSS